VIATVLTALLIHRSSSPAPLILWCAVGFGAGIGIFVYGFQLLQRRRLILDTPFSRIRSASMGLVEVNGQAVGPYTMIAPLTGRPCYYYRTLIWEYKQNGKNKQWVKVAGECMHLPFFVDDNTGRVLVDPHGADLDLHCDFKQEFCNSFFTIKDPAPPSVNSFLSRHGVVTDNKLKVEEFCIKPKNSLFILGTLADNSGLEVTPEPMHDAEALGTIASRPLSLSIGSFSLTTRAPEDDFAQAVSAPRPAVLVDAAPPQVIHLSGESGSIKTSEMTQQQKVAAALFKAGISNPAAWSAAGLGVSQIQVIADPSAGSHPGNGNGSGHGSDGKDSVEQLGFDARPPVVLMKGSNNKTFLISWRSQREVAQALAWKCTLMIWGGPALALLSLYAFLQIEHLL